jgi:hypothetical protein
MLSRLARIKRGPYEIVTEPFSSFDLAGLKDVDGFGQLPGAPGATAETDALQEIAQRLVRWARRHSPEAGHDAPVTLEISVQGEPRVSVALSDGEAVAVAVLRDELTRIVVAIVQQEGLHGG